MVHNIVLFLFTLNQWRYILPILGKFYHQGQRPEQKDHHYCPLGSLVQLSYHRKNTISILMTVFRLYSLHDI